MKTRETAHQQPLSSEQGSNMRPTLTRQSRHPSSTQTPKLMPSLWKILKELLNYTLTTKREHIDVQPPQSLEALIQINTQQTLLDSARLQHDSTRRSWTQSPQQQHNSSVHARCILCQCMQASYYHVQMTGDVRSSHRCIALTMPPSKTIWQAQAQIQDMYTVFLAVTTQSGDAEFVRAIYQSSRSPMESSREGYEFDLLDND